MVMWFENKETTGIKLTKWHKMRYDMKDKMRLETKDKIIDVIQWKAIRYKPAILIEQMHIQNHFTHAHTIKTIKSNSA